MTGKRSIGLIESLHGIFSPVGFGVYSWCFSDERLTLETSAIHQTSRAKNIPYQPLLIKCNTTISGSSIRTNISQSGLLIQTDTVDIRKTESLFIF